MEINYFKEFTVLAETKNYWEAAERLYLNQSTLSKHIKALEKELGVELFKRTTRRVELTEYGTAMLPYARTIVKTQFDYSAILMQLKNQNQKMLTIGSIPVIAQYDISNILIDFHKAFPEYNYRLMEEDTKALIHLLQNRKCELILFRETNSTLPRNFIGDGEIARIPYIQDYLVAVLPHTHPLAAQSEITLRELKDEKFCFIKEGTMMYDLCCCACQEANFIPNIVYSSHRVDNILDMVTKDNCVSLMMNRHAGSPAQVAGNTPYAVVKIVPSITSQLSLCYLKNNCLSDAARQFIRFFKNCTARNDF